MASDYKKIGGAWRGDKGISFKLGLGPATPICSRTRTSNRSDKKPDFDICVKASVMYETLPLPVYVGVRQARCQGNGQTRGQSQEPVQTPAGNVRAAFEMDSSVPF